jgi:hypothetical protein
MRPFFWELRVSGLAHGMHESVARNKSAPAPDHQPLGETNKC